jgi:two-component system, OmpR family, response regulator RegX3
MTADGKTTIVVVDDDDDTSALLRELLERRGYRAVAVSSGHRCLELLHAEVADVAIVDLQMPGMSGLELCRELRAHHPDVVAIVLTARADLSCADDAARAGARDTLVKPARISRLERAIGRALERRGDA